MTCNRELYAFTIPSSFLLLAWVSILWSYLDITLLFSSYVYLIFLLDLLSFSFHILSTLHIKWWRIICLYDSIICVSWIFRPLWFRPYVFDLFVSELSLITRKKTEMLILTSRSNMNRHRMKNYMPLRFHHLHPHGRNTHRKTDHFHKDNIRY